MKNLEKFLEKIKKLKNHHILHENDDYLIIGSEINISIYKEINTNLFQPYKAVLDKTFYISFLILLNEKDSQTRKIYEKKKLPILILPLKLKAAKIDLIEKYLDDFIEQVIKN